MSIEEPREHNQILSLLDKIKALERRVKILEMETGIITSTDDVKVDSRKDHDIEKSNAAEKTDQGGIESGIGEFGLAWIGNIVLLFGISFLMQFIQSNGYVLVSALMGYAVVGGIFLLQHYLRKSYAILSRTFNYTGIALLYYVTLRLHFYNDAVLIHSEAISVVILLLVVSFGFLYGVIKRSATISGISMVMMITTALVSNSTHVLLSLAVAASIVALALFYRCWFFL